jgi:hypothetical protein
VSGCWLVEGPSPVFLPEYYHLVIESEGCVLLPEDLIQSLDLEPGDLISLVRNDISIRLDLYSELLADLQHSVKPPNRWRCLEQFISRTLSSVGADGGLEIPSDLFSLLPGDRVVLEVLAQGLGHTLYLYRDHA